MIAALSSLVRDHGAFVLGFREGRSLVDKADEFLLQRALIDEIAVPGGDLIKELATNGELVEEETRRIHGAIREALQTAGWQTSRTAYAAYLTIRNAVRAIIKYSVGQDVNIAAVLGGLAGASAMIGDPNCEFMRAAVPVLRQYASQLLAFFNHSPEFRAYVEWALHMLEHDRKAQE